MCWPQRPSFSIIFGFRSLLILLIRPLNFQAGTLRNNTTGILNYEIYNELEPIVIGMRSLGIFYEKGDFAKIKISVSTLVSEDTAPGEEFTIAAPAQNLAEAQAVAKLWDKENAQGQ